MMRENFQWRRLLAVFCGGFLGTLARYGLSLTIQSMLGKGWPFDILFINVTGAFLLAFITTLADAALLIGPHRRLFFNVGFLGAYTTFSSLALGDVTLFSNQRTLLALLYILCSLLGGLLAVLLGQYSGMVLIAGVKQKTMQGALSLERSIREEEAELFDSQASLSELEEEERSY